MKPPRLILTLAVVAGALWPAQEALREDRLVMPSGSAVRMVCRALEPGEVVIFRLENDSAGGHVILRFLDTEATFGSGGVGFLGLDLTQEPGTYPLDVTVVRPGGATEHLRRDLALGAKEFRVRKLQVPQEFVKPPTPEIEERVRREAELVAWVYSHGTAEWLGKDNFSAPLAAAPFPNFGERRVYNGVPLSFHTGLDFSAPAGDPVAAANAGQVAMASHLYFGGKTVILDHGQGVFTSYGHMSKLLVRRGDLVRKGTVIGLIGSTGRSTGPHLHWSVRIGGARVDPRSLLALPLD
jgi:murein DD-endopeptidase MepM/ murein hydrolase activator NlpD